MEILSMTYLHLHQKQIGPLEEKKTETEDKSGYKIRTRRVIQKSVITIGQVYSTVRIKTGRLPCTRVCLYYI